MNDPKIVNNRILFAELFSDSMGTNYRAAELENRKPKRHELLCQVSPALLANPDTWKRVRILLEGIKKSNISQLFSPEQILGGGSDVQLVYEPFQGKVFEQILEESEERNLPITFDLAFSIALAIADIIEVGSSIIVSGEKSFHGMLTPDNILIHYDGKIFLKNYGIFPYLDRNDPLFTEFEKKYGAWLAPEMIRKEKSLPQSDIYHLGYLIYRMLTGKYFSCSDTEDFNAKFANIAFKQHIPTTDKDLFTHIINFFKKTLNPDPTKRFRSIKEFKEFITNFFHIEELSSITFNLAYFMNSLTGDAQEKEALLIAEEKKFVLPEPKKAPPPAPGARNDEKLVENLLAGLDEQKKTPWPLIGGAAAAVLVIAMALFFYFGGKSKKAEEMAIKTQEQIKQQLLSANEAKYEQKMKELEATFQQKQAATEEERKAIEAKQKEMLATLQKQKQEEEDRIKAQQAQEMAKRKKEEDEQLAQQLATKQKEEQERLAKEEEVKKQEALLAQKKIEESKAKEGDLVGISEVTSKPEKVSGNPPSIDSNSILRKKYRNVTLNVMFQALVDENGSVVKVKVMGTPTPGNDIKEMVSDTVMRWKYKPATKDGVRVKVWTTPYPIQFKL